MKKSVISYLVISDIHLGHSRTPTEHIVNNLDTLIKKHHNTIKKTDIIFLAGDVYDKLLASSSKEFVLANEWLANLAMYCAKYNIIFRILEGTPSHDWKQSTVFSKTLDTLNIDVDYAHVKELSIEYIESLDIHILYVPDEWCATSAETLSEVKVLLDKYNLSQVDIGIMHGQFHHQLPMIELPSSHEAHEYLNIVKYYINIGHIHTSSAYKRILAQGSFDRLAHGEEEAKGCMLMTIYHTGDMMFKFLKNTGAYPYKKYDISNKPTKDIVKYLTKLLPKLPLGSRVKLIVSNSEVNKLLKPIQERFKDLIFDVVKKKVVIKQRVKNNKVITTPFEIRKDNIEELLLIEISKRGLSEEEILIIREELKPLL